MPPRLLVARIVGWCTTAFAVLDLVFFRDYTVLLTRAHIIGLQICNQHRFLDKKNILTLCLGSEEMSFSCLPSYLPKLISSNINCIFWFYSSFGVVGWPPIRTFRMNSLFNQAKENASEAGAKKPIVEPDMQEDKEESKKGRTVGWVKVNMEGDIIGRKVDLNAHRSYKTLASALELMFMKPSIGLCTSSKSYSLIFYFHYIYIYTLRTRHCTRYSFISLRGCFFCSHFWTWFVLIVKIIRQFKDSKAIRQLIGVSAHLWGQGRGLDACWRCSLGVSPIHYVSNQKLNRRSYWWPFSKCHGRVLSDGSLLYYAGCL